MPMTTSAIGRATLTQREGCVLTAYQDSVGVWTIGVGHTGRAADPPVTPGMSITRAQADAILSADLAPFEAAVNRAITRPMTQNEFDAMVSLAFNIGAAGFTGSTVVHKFNASDPAGAGDAFLMWDRPPELKGRRIAERAQFLDNRQPDAQAPVTTFAPPHILPKSARGKPARSQTGKVAAGAAVVIGAGTAASQHFGLSWAPMVLVALAIAGAAVAVPWWQARRWSAAPAAKAAPPASATVTGPGITPTAPASPAPPAPKPGG